MFPSRGKKDRNHSSTQENGDGMKIREYTLKPSLHSEYPSPSFLHSTEIGCQETQSSYSPESACCRITVTEINPHFALLTSPSPLCILSTIRPKPTLGNFFGRANQEDQGNLSLSPPLHFIGVTCLPAIILSVSVPASLSLSLFPLLLLYLIPLEVRKKEKKSFMHLHTCPPGLAFLSLAWRSHQESLQPFSEAAGDLILRSLALWVCLIHHLNPHQILLFGNRQHSLTWNWR